MYLLKFSFGVLQYISQHCLQILHTHTLGKAFPPESFVENSFNVQVMMLY